MRFGVLVWVLVVLVFVKWGMLIGLSFYLALFVGCWLWVLYNDDDDDDDGDMNVAETPPDEIPHSHWQGFRYRIAGAISTWHTLGAWDVSSWMLFRAALRYLLTGSTGRIRLPKP